MRCTTKRIFWGCLILVLLTACNLQPDHNLFLLCSESQENFDSFALYRYEIAPNVWTRELNGRIFNNLSSLPNDSALILTERAADMRQTILWSPGSEQLLFGEDWVTRGEFTPDGRLVASPYDEFGKRDTVDTYDWSLDGHWLASVTENNILLISPNQEKIQSFPFAANVGSCQNLQWMK